MRYRVILLLLILSIRVACSLCHVEALLLCGLSNYALVVSEHRFWLLEHILASCNKLLVVVRAAKVTLEIPYLRSPITI